MISKSRRSCIDGLQIGLLQWRHAPPPVPARHRRPRGRASGPQDRLRLARPADQARRAVHARHRPRHHRPLRGRAAVGQARPAGGGGERRRRQRQYRQPAGGARQARRPHADVVGQHAGDECQPLQEPALRSGGRLRAARPDRLGLAGAGGQSRPEAQHAGRARRGGEGRAQDAHLRQPGRRHAASSVDGAGRDRVRHRAGARALQGHGGRGAGSAGRPDRLHVPAGPCLGPAHPRRQAEGDRRRQPQAPAAAARRADPDRKRPEGRRCRHVVRLVRAQGHADRHRRRGSTRRSWRS